MTYSTTVRTFIVPKPLGDRLAAANPRSMEGSKGKRPDATAANYAKSYPQEAKDPLASHKNPASKPGITFAAQDKLPKLPIPELEDTCKRYLEALKPLQSPREHQDTIAAVNEFKKRDGPDLHDRLKKYATGKSSYIEQFCKHRSLDSSPRYSLT